MDKDRYYLEIAKAVSMKSTCLKKHYGAVIVKNDEVISSGYNGAPRGEAHCSACTKQDCGKDISTYLSCASVHAEMNAIISAARKDMIGATMYLFGSDLTGQIEEDGIEINAIPCEICFRLLKNSGIEKVISRDGACAIRGEDGILRRV